MATAADSTFVRRALRLAERGRFGVSPNPLVGAVLVRDGAVVGEGWHERAGEAHAEARALAIAGERARGATLYVTLEPCAHHGRTPPCADAVITAGVLRVVAAHRDPDPRVAGRGFARLRDAGVAVEVGLGREAAIRMNWRFLVARVAARPAVTLKWAMSLDGKIATAAGRSQWISSPPARRWALAERESHDALLVGSGTILVDDPRLDRRLGKAPGQNVRVILDRRLRTPVTARLLRLPGAVLIYTQPSSDADLEARRTALTAAGAEVIELPAVTPRSVLADLDRRGVQSVLVEGGGTVAAAFARDGMFDRLAVVLAPKLLGGAHAPGPLALTLSDDPSSAPLVSDLRLRRVGPDIVVEGFDASCLADLSSAVAE